MLQTSRPPPLTSRSRLAASVPSVGLWLLGAPVWGAVMALSCQLAMWVLHWTPYAHRDQLLLLFLGGGMLGWLTAVPVTRFFSLGRPVETRFAAGFLFLSIGTVAFTAFLFALQYRSFYAQWHAPFGTRIWAFQFVFTSASAVFQFFVLGLRLFLPFGLVFLLAASLLLARRNR